MPALLEARALTKTFHEGLLGGRRVVALRDVSLPVPADRPAILAVVGESGSGKTTLARCLLGLTTPTAGEVRYRGEALARMSRAARRAFRREVQAIFQDPYEAYNPFYRVDHALEVPVAQFGLARSRAESRRLIEEALEAVGLRPDETLGRFPHQLSGGQRQRVMVARALALRPRVILADEPVSMVDASLRATILGALHRMAVERAISIVYITHDLATAYQVSDHVVVLYRGALVEAGDVELVVKRPRHPYTQLLVGAIPVLDPERAPTADARGAAPGRTSPAVDPAPAAPGRASSATDPMSPTPGHAPPARAAARSLPWHAGAPPAPRGTPRPEAPGCPFEPRCPAALPACRMATPPLHRTAERHVVACFLHADAPVLPSGALGAVLHDAPPARAHPTPADGGARTR